MLRNSDPRSSVVLVLALLGLASVAGAQTVQYTANGFESPHFTLGNLAGDDTYSGQDGWLVTCEDGPVPDLGAIVVQSTTVRDGAQAVDWDAGRNSIAFAHLRRNVMVWPTTEEPVAEVEFDFMIGDGTVPSYHWALDVYSHVVNRLVLWAVRADGSLWYVDGPGGDWVDSGVTLVRNHWYDARTEIDMTAEPFTCRIFIDNTLVASPEAIDSYIPCLAFAAIYLDQPGDDHFYMDNFVVRTSPEGGGAIFSDGFESSTTSAWTVTEP
jgi:hypothetical protein